MVLIDEWRKYLLKLARDAGDQYYDHTTRRVLISRDTVWYAISLLFDESAERRSLGSTLLREVPSEDGTHTPATMIAVIRGISEMLDESAIAALSREISRELVHAAEVVWRDGNVNHPLGAWATLTCGGELCQQPWAVELGLRRLKEFQRVIGDRRHRYRRQAEMSEYNSLTYTALDLCFLAIIAEYCHDPEARDLALFLEERLWLDVAMHYHRPSQQFSGPHSRSYQEDSVGGFSSLHAVLMAAGLPIFCEPSLAARFEHPSTLVQCGLTAIAPFHLPRAARQMALEKPLPFSFQKTTYAEHYHENSWRASPTGDKPSTFAFDDEVYPGGWSDLTTFLTSEYALGTASLPYVNAGHSDSFMLRIRRSVDISGMEDFRSIYTRGVYNHACVGQRNDAHIPGTVIDASYLYEEGRCATYQHDGRAIVCYAPKRAGHRGVKSFRLDVIAGYWAPFDRMVVDGHEVTTLPLHIGSGSRLVFQDFQTFGAFIFLGPAPAPRESPITMRKVGEFLVVSMYNYDGPEHDFERDELTLWRTGFYIELATREEFPTLEEFHHHVMDIRCMDTWSQKCVRRVDVHSGGHHMVFECDPFRERILHRLWDGAEEEVLHFAVGGVPDVIGEFRPTTLFGAEAMQRRH